MLLGTVPTASTTLACCSACRIVRCILRHLRCQSPLAALTPALASAAMTTPDEHLNQLLYKEPPSHQPRGLTLVHRRGLWPSRVAPCGIWPVSQSCALAHANVAAAAVVAAAMLMPPSSWNHHCYWRSAETAPPAWLSACCRRWLLTALLVQPFSVAHSALSTECELHFAQLC